VKGLKLAALSFDRVWLPPTGIARARRIFSRRIPYYAEMSGGYDPGARHSGGSCSFARKPFIGCADSIFSIEPFKSAHYEVRLRHLLEVIDGRAVHRCAA
jgi:hypothetical protein